MGNHVEQKISGSIDAVIIALWKAEAQNLQIDYVNVWISGGEERNETKIFNKTHYSMLPFKQH